MGHYNAGRENTDDRDREMREERRRIERWHNGVAKWDMRFLRMAKMVSTWSKDPSTQCGAVIVRSDRSLVSVGYNGFPRGCCDDKALYDNREVKLERVIHAEQNAILYGIFQWVDGSTMYTWPPGLGPSCQRCAAHIIGAGIKRVVHVTASCEEGFSSRWRQSCAAGLGMYKEAGVQVDFYFNSEFTEHE